MLSEVKIHYSDKYQDLNDNSFLIHFTVYVQSLKTTTECFTDLDS